MSQATGTGGREALILHAADNVATALRDIAPGRHEWALGDRTITVEVAEPIEAGFKVAIEPIPAESPVRKYGHVIGIATEEIPPGRVVHVHNTRSSVQ